MAMQVSKLNENVILLNLQKRKTELGQLSEKVAQHHATRGHFTGSNIEELINVTAEIKQLAVEFELFVKINYGKEVSDGEQGPKEFKNQADFEEGMCNQDIERFRQQEGLPMNGLYGAEKDEVEGDGASCYY